MSSGRMSVVTFKLPRELVDELDDVVRRGGFSSRSEAIRYAIALLISQHQKSLSGSAKHGEKRTI